MAWSSLGCHGTAVPRSAVVFTRATQGKTRHCEDAVPWHPAPNPNRKLRCISNMIVSLKEPMRFDRDVPGEFSPLERAVLRGLGVERLEFKPTGARVKTADYSVLPEEMR